MDADLDTLATALYVRTDDLLKAAPDRVPWRRSIGFTLQITDAELITLAVMQALLRFTSETRWLRYAHCHLRHLLPYLAQQSGYNRRLRRLAPTLEWLIGVLARDTSLWTDDVWVADSTPVECGRSRETARRSDLAGYAEYGDCASHSRFFWGLRLHLLATLHGLPVGFALTGAKADERQVLLSIFTADDRLLSDRHGQLLIADKNCYGHQFEHELDQAGLRLLRRPARASVMPGPVSGSSSRCAKPLSRSSTPRRGSSISKTTAGTPSPVSPCACISACSP